MYGLSELGNGQLIMADVRFTGLFSCIGKGKKDYRMMLANEGREEDILAVINE